MNSLNDTAKLYQLFGGQAGDYQELRRSEQAKSAKQRWPLLAWLDLSALHVSEPPQVQVGENAKPVANLRPAEQAPTPTSPAFKPSLNSPAFKAPITPAPVQAAPAKPQPAWLSPPKPAAAQRPAPPVGATFAQQIKPAKLQLNPSPNPTSAPATAPAPVHAPVHAPMHAPTHAPISARAPAPSPAPAPVAVPAQATQAPLKSPAPKAAPASPSSIGTAPYLQQLMSTPTRLQALGAAASQPTSSIPPVPPVPAVSPVSAVPPATAINAEAPVVANTRASAATLPAADRAISGGASQGLQDIFSRLAQPAGSPPTPAAPLGSLWSNLTSRL